MSAAALKTLRNDPFQTNEACASRGESTGRFEPVSRIIERYDEKLLEMARPFAATASNN